MEVIDAPAFVESLSAFFSQHGLKGKHALMVLDDSVVFNKSVPIDTDSNPADIADQYIDAMPLEPGQRACLRVLSDTEINLYATNGRLYQAVAEALNEAGAAKLLAITPATAYPSAGGRQQLATAVQQYVNDTAVRGKADFQHAALV